MNPAVHLLSLWLEPDPEVLRDPDLLLLRFLEAVRETGLTVLAVSPFRFPGAGLTVAVVLAESHAALHSWPEQGRAWVELATCGDPAGLSAFRSAIAARIPGKVDDGWTPDAKMGEETS